MKKILFTLSLLLSLTIGAQTIAPSGIYQFKKTIDSTAFKTIGSSPITLISAPGSNKSIAIIPGTIRVRRTAGTKYTFGTATYLYLSNGDLMESIDVCSNFFPGSSGNNASGNTPSFTQNCINANLNGSLIITSSDGSDPSAGNATIMITFLYTVLNLN